MSRIDVVGALIYRDNQVLLAQRSCKNLDRKWEFAGGKVGPGETHQEALRREIQEELCINIKVGRKVDSVDFELNDKAYTLHCYWAEIQIGEPVADEHHSIAWVPIKDLLNYDLAPADIPIAREAMKNDRSD